MRYIELSEDAQKELEEIYRVHSKSYVRQRAQCLLLSNQGYSVPTLADIFSTRTHTVRDWFTRWEKKGISGLEILPGRGLKPAIKEGNSELISSIREEVSADPRNLSNVVEKLNVRWGLQISVRQLQSFLKKLKYSWRRFRQCVKKCQDPDMYEYLVSQLCTYMVLEERGFLTRQQ